MSGASRNFGVRAVRELGAGAVLGWRAFAGARSRAWPRGEVVRQALTVGNKSLVLVGSTLAFVGMILVFQSGLQAQRLLGDVSAVGPIFIGVVIREFGPIMTGLMVAARVGAGISAEVGTMVVTEQVDALRMNAADPVRWVVSPRVLAAALAFPALTVYGSVAAVLSGAWTASAFFDIPSSTFLQLYATSMGDVVTGLTKTAVFAVFIPVVAARAGLLAEGGSEGVGAATTRAVVVGSIGVIVLDALLGALFHTLGL